ncbi:MAG: NfeD family protein [Rhodobacteraceae bacterium]|nr:NfeD family protein [Paracoccaceae bacterium]
MEFLGFLEGLSPWWWVALAFVLGALEMVTSTFVLIWLALAALVMAGILAAGAILSGALQVALFATLSVVLTFGGRYLLNRFGDGGEHQRDELNQRGQRFIGRNAKVLECTNSKGSVEVEGMRWRARWQPGTGSEIGATVQVTKADGMVLEVRE